MTDERHPGSRCRAARIAGMPQGGAAPAARPAPDPVGPLDVDAILRGIDLLPPRIGPVADPSDRTDPPVYRAPWYRPARVDPLRGEPEWGMDDPEALRASGAKVVATALAQLAEEGLMSWRRSTREVAALLLEWLDGDGGEFDDLAADIGLRPKRGASFVSIRKLAERDAILREVIAMPRWGNRAPIEVARDVRKEFEDFGVNGGWSATKDGPCPKAMPRSAFWRILRLDLHYPLPNIQTIRAMIEADRE